MGSWMGPRAQAEEARLNFPFELTTWDRKFYWADGSNEATRYATGANGGIQMFTNNAWYGLNGSLKNILAACDGAVVGINDVGGVFLYGGGSGKDTRWRQMPGQFVEIALGGADKLYALDDMGRLQQWGKSGTWQRQSEVFQSISAGCDGTLAGIETGGRVRVLKDGADDWDTWEVNLNMVALHDVQHVVGIDRDGFFTWRWPDGTWGTSDLAVSTVASVGEKVVYATTDDGTVYTLRLDPKLWKKGTLAQKDGKACPPDCGGGISSMLPPPKKPLPPNCFPQWSGETPDEAAIKAVAGALNQARQKEGFKPLEKNMGLMAVAWDQAVATAHACDLTQTIDGKTAKDRIQDKNLALVFSKTFIANQATPEATVAAWLASGAHSAYFLDPDLTQMGVAVLKDPNGKPWYVVVLGQINR